MVHLSPRTNGYRHHEVEISEDRTYVGTCVGTYGYVIYPPAEAGEVPDPIASDEGYRAPHSALAAAKEIIDQLIAEEDAGGPLPVK